MATGLSDHLGPPVLTTELGLSGLNVDTGVKEGASHIRDRFLPSLSLYVEGCCLWGVGVSEGLGALCPSSQSKSGPTAESRTRIEGIVGGMRGGELSPSATTNHPLHNPTYCVPISL